MNNMPFSVVVLFCVIGGWSLLSLACAMYAYGAQRRMRAVGCKLLYGPGWSNDERRAILREMKAAFDWKTKWLLAVSMPLFLVFIAAEMLIGGSKQTKRLDDEILKRARWDAQPNHRELLTHIEEVTARFNRFEAEEALGVRFESDRLFRHPSYHTIWDISMSLQAITPQTIFSTILFIPLFIVAIPVSLFAGTVLRSLLRGIERIIPARELSAILLWTQTKLSWT